MSDKVYITECPRDAMQGIKEFIPTEKKVMYLNNLLKVGFDVIDIGSFVSPKAIPQMQDTAEVLEQITLSENAPKLLVIVANSRGASDAVMVNSISYLGFPFSISETFQRRNTNAGIEESLERVKGIVDIAGVNGKKVLIYISMAFGNPYGDQYHPDVAVEWVHKLGGLGIEDFAMADTIGVSDVQSISSLFSSVLPAFPNYKIGAHLHSNPEDTVAKVKAAYESGCRRFDSAIRGYGGCPMANDDLTGNIATEILVHSLKENGAQLNVNEGLLGEAIEASSDIF